MSGLKIPLTSERLPFTEGKVGLGALAGEADAAGARGRATKRAFVQLSVSTQAIFSEAELKIELKLQGLPSEDDG